MSHALLTGALLRIAHFLLAFLAFYLTIAGPLSWLPYLSVFWLAMLTMYVVNRGCVITQLEKYLTGQDITIVDPLLKLFRVPITHYNRNAITMLGGISMLFWGLLRIHMFKK